jgi:hypothetical protein
MNNLSICIWNKGFYKRLSYVLSSLVQCSFKGDVLISCFSQDSYFSFCEKLKELFGKQLDLKIRIYNDDLHYTQRNYCRSDDIKTSDKDWLFFADSDNVFYNNFFIELQNKIDINKEKVLYSMTRWTMEENSGNILTPEVKYYDNAYDNAKKHIVHLSGHGIIRGAGYCQIVRRKDCNIYCLRKNGFIGDIHFRRNFKVEKIEMKEHLVHLQHNRLYKNGELR